MAIRKTAKKRATAPKKSKKTSPKTVKAIPSDKKTPSSRKRLNTTTAKEAKSNDSLSSSKAPVRRKTINRTTIQYVLPLGNGWVVKSSTALKFIVITDSKREAISIARNLARTKHSKLIVHGKSGNIEVSESYTI